MIKALLLIYFIWGFNWVVMKEANYFFSPIMFVTCRFGLGAIILLLVNLWLRLPPPPRKYWKWIIITGLLQTSIGNVAIQIGMKDLGAGFAAVIDYTMPVWVAILAHIFLKEKLTTRKIMGIVISMIGLFILMKIDTVGSISAILITLTAAIAWAVASVIVKIQDRVIANDRKKGDVGECNIIQYTTWQMVAGAVGIFIYAIVTGDFEAQWTGTGVACILYNGILASAFAFFLWNYVLVRMEASKASIAILAVPVVGVLCGILFLGEPMTVNIALGMFLILTGIFLIVAQKKLVTSNQ